jgi:ubiquinone/menaquinone biosynthesis C-methylase UbiE
VQGGRLLNVGAGTSPMGIDLIQDGIGLVENIDICETVVRKMESKYENEPRLIWRVMDCQNLEYAECSFDSVIEKGTIDALSCGSESSVSVERMLREIYRVLKPGGTFVSISFGPPTLRLPYLRQAGLDWAIGEPILVPKLMIANCYYYVYWATKRTL